MIYLTVFSTASERLNLNNPTQTGMGLRPNGSNLVPVQCGVKTDTTQRPEGTRHGAIMY
jgi:hypothetical protein